MTVDAAMAARGKARAAQCAACHGAEGRGDAATLVPGLGGQAPGYLRSQMLLFKQDKRSPGDEALEQVKAIMRTLSDEAIAELAAYYATREVNRQAGKGK